jgi:hypothetical protein
MDGIPVNANAGVLDVLASVDAESSEGSVEPVPVELDPVAPPDDPAEALVLAGAVVVVVVVLPEDVAVPAGAAVKEMATVQPDNESVVSAAVRVTDSGVVSVTSNTAFPSLSL